MNIMTNHINKYDDVIDSRDVIARIADLERWDVADDPDLLDEEERHELVALRALAAQAADYSEDWEYGETLIRDTYFQTYAQELADDIGAIDSNAGWPNTCIDWEWAARELRMDYTCVEFDDVTYWIRSS